MFRDHKYCQIWISLLELHLFYPAEYSDQNTSCPVSSDHSFFSADKTAQSNKTHDDFLIV